MWLHFTIRCDILTNMILDQKRFFSIKYILYIGLLLCSIQGLGVNNANPKILTISPQVSLPIGVKIWFNESGGSVDGLTAWNDGENFASLGIGHFVWHPYGNGRNPYSSFPTLIKYMEKRGNVAIPTWLRSNLYCPWQNKAIFVQAKNSPRMAELRIFLQKTIPIQAEYMVKNLEETLPELLVMAKAEDRALIYNNFYTLARTSSGVYALVDFLNFKGAGLSSARGNYENGSGLLHVLRDMSKAPQGMSPLRAYAWAAKHALIRRVERSSPDAHHERWLAGWFNRINTYVEGEYLHATQVA